MKKSNETFYAKTKNNILNNVRNKFIKRLKRKTTFTNNEHYKQYIVP